MAIQEVGSQSQDPGILKAIPSMRWFWSHWARPLRFAGMGVIAMGAQLLALTLLSTLGWFDLAANVLAVLIGTQISFLLHATVTWHDHHTTGRTAMIAWLRFNGVVLTTMALNQIIFLFAERWLAIDLASVIGSGVVAVLNYGISNWWVFVG